MGVSDHTANIIECDAAHLLALFRYGEETAMNGDMKAIRRKRDQPPTRCMQTP